MEDRFHGHKRVIALKDGIQTKKEICSFFFLVPRPLGQTISALNHSITLPPLLVCNLCLPFLPQIQLLGFCSLNAKFGFNFCRASFYPHKTSIISLFRWFMRAGYNLIVNFWILIRWKHPQPLCVMWFIRTEKIKDNWGYKYGHVLLAYWPDLTKSFFNVMLFNNFWRTY